MVFPAGRGALAFWQPSIATLGEYQQADLILLNGVNYARWVNKVRRAKCGVRSLRQRSCKRRLAQCDAR
ncbi:MAG: hypothetical protein R3F37_08445 [Candidatus Competibacteraceae bacterium]